MITARGVYGLIKTPPDASWVTTLAPGRASAGDIYLHAPTGGDFVQYGWYVGSVGQLPYVTTPHVLYGEYAPAEPNGEILRKGSALAWNTWYSFKIEFSSTPGKYNFFLNGTYYNTTVLNHTTHNEAAFNGEVSNSCIRMDGRGYHYNSPTRTLQYLTYSSQGARWTYFVDDYVKTHSSLFLGSGGDVASCYAYGFAAS